MFKIVCVTNRKLCNDFLKRIKELHENGVTVILREKDLTESEYTLLAKKILDVCPDVILHSYVNVARDLGVNKIHLPFHMLNKDIADEFETVGVSIHSVNEAVTACELGATYITAGHIFATDCKKGLAPRGTDFLQSVVKSVNIPVYGIGGMSPRNTGFIQKTSADGACIMSGFMTCDNVNKYLDEINKNLLKK